jgi:hypothetical protein
VKDELRDITQELMDRGGFGTPTIFINGHDMYWGNDRIELAPERCRVCIIAHHGWRASSAATTHESAAECASPQTRHVSAAAEFALVVESGSLATSVSVSCSAPIRSLEQLMDVLLSFWRRLLQ